MPAPSRLVLVAALALTPAVGCQGARTSTAVPASAAKTVISLQKIDCQSCGARVVTTLEKQPGVYEASFDKALAEVTVHYDAAQTGNDAFLAIVREHGYEGVVGAGQGAYVPEVEFDPALDVKKIAEQGESVEIEDHIVEGKVTVFDFYAVWCKPCRQVDHHMKKVLATADDVALRKLDVVDWDSELAKTYLRNIPDLPFVIVYGRDGKRVKRISGLKLDELDAAIDEGRRP